MTHLRDDAGKISWRGSAMKEIFRDSEQHSILCDIHFNGDSRNTPPPPRRGKPNWDWWHVRLPCSVESEYPFGFVNEHNGVRSQWDIIKEALTQLITNSQQLQHVIIMYNFSFKEQWNFIELHKLFEEELDKKEAQEFFKGLLPRIIRLALDMPKLIQAPIPLLTQSLNHAITLSQQQISCLLANAFLCTFPHRNTIVNAAESREYMNYPEINFHRLFQSTTKVVLEKIKCLLHYFSRVCPKEAESTNVPTGIVTFERRSLEQSVLSIWETCKSEIGINAFHINSAGIKVDDGDELIQKIQKIQAISFQNITLPKFPIISCVYIEILPSLGRYIYLISSYLRSADKHQHFAIFVNKSTGFMLESS